MDLQPLKEIKTGKYRPFQEQLTSRYSGSAGKLLRRTPLENIVFTNADGAMPTVRTSRPKA